MLLERRRVNGGGCGGRRTAEASLFVWRPGPSWVNRRVGGEGGIEKEVGMGTRW